MVNSQITYAGIVSSSKVWAAAGQWKLKSAAAGVSDRTYIMFRIYISRTAALRGDLRFC